MNYNAMNGGLVTKHEQEWIFANFKTFTTEPAEKYGGMRWFMDTDGSYMYYSDQRKGNALCRMDLNTLHTEIILDRPCAQVVLKQEGLYYIDEEDQRLHYMELSSRRSKKLTAESITAFLVEGELLYYSSMDGIYSLSNTAAVKEKVHHASASILVKVGAFLAYNEKQQQYVLSLLDLNTSTVRTLSDVTPSSLNTDGTYLYCANRLYDRSVYRIDPRSGQTVRICGESAEYLHIIEGDLIFAIGGVWHKMPLTGGNYEKLRG
jgi:hypothetical protein